MLRMIVNASCLIMAISVLLPAPAEANSWFFGERVKGTWIRETGTSQMLVSIARDGGFLTAASSGAFNTPGQSGPLLLSSGVGTWKVSGPNSVSLTQLQYAYSDETGDLLFVLRMTGEINFDRPPQRFGKFTSATATFELEAFPAGFPIVPGTEFPGGTFENTFDRTP